MNIFSKQKTKIYLFVILFILVTAAFYSCSEPNANFTAIKIDTGLNLSRGIEDVEYLKLTVSADDIKTITKEFTEEQIFLNLKNGKNRLFVLEALNKSKETIYKDSKTVNLIGSKSVKIVFKMKAVEQEAPVVIECDLETFHPMPTLTLEEGATKIRYATSKEGLEEAVAETIDDETIDTKEYTFKEDLSPGVYYWQYYSEKDQNEKWSEIKSLKINDKITSNSENENYNISYAYDIYYISITKKAKNKNFKLLENIDMNKLSQELGRLSKKAAFGGIGDYTGTFDGNYKTISNLSITETETNTGLFKTTNGAKIKNLTIKDVNITGTTYVGGLIGYATNSTITNCKNITTNESSSTVTGTGHVGGLIGYSSGLEISNCYNTAIVTAKANIENKADVRTGGLIGLNAASTITNCYNAGSVTINSENEGSAAEKRNSDKNKTIFTGGLIGENSGSEIDNSYNRGNINIINSNSEKATYYTGGFIGYNNSDIYYCYSAAIVTGPSLLGAFIGYNKKNSGTIKSCFFDSDLCNDDNTNQTAVGIQTLSLQNSGTYTEKGWDFSNTWSIGGANNNGYPYLQSLIKLF